MLPILAKRPRNDLSDLSLNWKTKDLRARYHGSDQEGAFKAAVRAVRKSGRTYYLYASHKYMTFMYRADWRKDWALCPASNNGRVVLVISPSCVEGHVTVEEWTVRGESAPVLTEAPAHE